MKRKKKITWSRMEEIEWKRIKKNMMEWDKIEWNRIEQKIMEWNKLK